MGVVTCHGCRDQCGDRGRGHCACAAASVHTGTRGWHLARLACTLAAGHSPGHTQPLHTAQTRRSWGEAILSLTKQINNFEFTPLWINSAEKFIELWIKSEFSLMRGLGLAYDHPQPHYKLQRPAAGQSREARVGAGKNYPTSVPLHPALTILELETNVSKSINQYLDEVIPSSVSAQAVCPFRLKTTFVRRSTVLIMHLSSLRPPEPST